MRGVGKDRGLIFRASGRICFLCLAIGIFFPGDGFAQQAGEIQTEPVETPEAKEQPVPDQDAINQQEIEQLQSSLEDRDPLEKLAAAIIANAKGDATFTPPKIEQAEAVAAQMSSALLSAGDTTEMRRFVDLFYADMYPASDDAAATVWENLSSKEQAATQSIDIQFLRVQAQLLDFKSGLTSPASQLVTPSELLEFRRDELNQALELVRVAKDTLFERRKKFSADRYRQMSSALLVAEAEIYMSIADVGYRLAGASLVTELTSGANQTNSTANYGAARQSLFEALLLNPDSVHAKVLAADIEDRLDWLSNGRAFGGRRFYEVEPVMGSIDGQSWTPIAQLSGSIETLRRLTREVSNHRSAERINELVEKFSLRLEQAREKRRLQFVDLSQKIADLEYRVQTGNIEAAEALEQNTQAIRDRVAQSESTRAEFQARSDALDDLIAAKTKEVQMAVAALAELTNQGDLFQLRKFGRTAESVLNGTEQLIEEVHSFDGEGIKARAKQLKGTFEELKTAGGTTLDIIKFELEQLKNSQVDAEKAGEEAAAAIELAKSNYFEEVAKKNIEAAQNKIDRLSEELAKVQLNTDEEIREFNDKIYELTYGNFEREKERVEARIKAVREKIDNARQLIELFKTNKERVEEAIAAAQLAVQAAGSIPSGVIAGTAAGTFTQKPQSIMKVQELGLKIIESAQKVEMDIRKAEQIIRDLDETISQYRREFERIDFGVAKANLDASIEEAKAAGTDLKQGITDKLLAARQQVANEIERSGKRLEEAFRLSTAKMTAHKAQFEAQVEAIKANIRGVEARAMAEERKARLLVGEIEVLKGDLQRLANEKSGIQEAIKRAEELTGSEIAELEAQADIEAEQFDERARPLIARLNHLRNMASLLVSGEDTGNIRIPVHEIANAVGGVDLSATAQKTVEELDKANRLLFQFANWLYLMTRNPQALDWAITAQNAYEVEQAYTQLHEIYVTLQSTTGLATPRYFVVRIPREALTKSFSDETGALPGKVRFTVNPSLASLSTRAPQQLGFSDPEHVGVEEISLYAPLDSYLSDTSETAGTLSGSAEIVFAPFIETEPGAHHFLWDAWVVPNWNAPSTPEISIVGLRPIGPTYYRINEITQEHPVLRSREANYSSTSFSYDKIRSQHEQAIRFVSSGAGGSLIDGTLPGMNYRGILGRGLGNTWELTAPAEWSDIGAPAWSFDAIDSIDIVFGYLVSPERTSGQTLSKRDVSKAVSDALSAPTSSETCNDLNDRWLCKLAETARFVQREESKESDDPDGSRRGDFRESHVFSRSAGARLMRLDALNEIAGAVPKGFELGRRSVAERGGAPVLGQWFVEGEPAQTSVREVFLDLFCLEGADEECKHRTPLDRFGYRDLTHQIVRGEMLEWTDEIPAPVGPIELIRTWRSVESLFGRLDPNSRADQANGRATLLADLREIEIVLRQVGKQMELLRERISGPIAVARRMVVEYELARSQIDFMRDLATALSNTADQNGSTGQPDAVTEQLERLQELIRANLSQFSCQHAWFMAMNAHEEMDISIEDYSALMATTLVDALEPDAAYLVSREDPEALVLEVFPFPECQGIFLDAKRRLEAAVVENE